MQLLQDYLICITVEYKDALLLCVVSLVALEGSVWNARSIYIKGKESMMKHMERKRMKIFTEMGKCDGD